MPAPKKGRPGFSFLICPDSFLIRQQLDILTQQFAPPSGKWKTSVFWGDEAPGSRFWESLKQQGLFLEYRAIVIRRAQEWGAQIWKNLDAALASGSSAIWPIFCLEGEFEKGKHKIPVFIQKSRCFVYSEKQGWHWNNPPLAGKLLSRFVESEAKKRKLSLNAEALHLFCSSIRPDASSVINELDKLALLYADKAITPDMLNLEASSPEANAFECLKNLYNGNLAKVWQEISQSAASSLLFFLVALLARDLHIFWQLNSGKNPYLYPADAAIKKSIATRLGKKGIGQCFVLLADIEYHVKSGQLSPEQALDKLLVELGRLFSPHAVG